MMDTEHKPGPGEVRDFWLGAGPEAWYKQDDAFDAEITDRFGALWETARDGHLKQWVSNGPDALALILLTDQFPRNMFRGSAKAFATDQMAKRVACTALDRGWDRKTPEPERQFFYMPFMHSERVADQDHCVRLIKERMGAGNNLLHARAHREIIRRFNRFPYRNAALGRATTEAETVFMNEGGYGAILREMEAA